MNTTVFYLQKHEYLVDTVYRNPGIGRYIGLCHRRERLQHISTHIFRQLQPQTSPFVDFILSYDQGLAMIQAPILSVRNSHLQNSSSEWSGKHKIHPNATESDTTANEQPVKPRPYALKSKSFAGIKFVPKLGHALEDWIDLPVDHDQKTNIIFNSVTLPFKWLLWTSKALAGLPPHQSLRERLCNQSASLGSVAGLFLVIAISAYFIPPSKDPC